MIDLLKVLLSVDIMIFAWAVAKYCANISSRPYVKMSEQIASMNIPLGKKMKLMKRIRQ